MKKGEAGYISSKKIRAIIKVVLEFGIVAALLLLGIQQTGDRMNWLTLVAILGCLPASKALVELIMIVPHRSIEKEKAAELHEKIEILTMVYDLVLTSEHHIMPIDVLAISDNMICGYSSSAKLDISFATKHIKQMLGMNQMNNITVKLFDNYTAFITRAEGMQNIASVEKRDTKQKEERIKQMILNISL